MRKLVVVLVVLLTVGAVPASVAGASTTISLDEARDDQRRSETVSFTFRAQSNTTVSATDSFSRAGGDVEFAFDSWRDLDGSGSGGDTSWSATAGHTYRVRYEISAASGADERRYSGTAEITDGGTVVASEPLSVTVEYLSPQFGAIGRQSTDLVFEDRSQTSTTLSVSIPNDGRGVMLLSELTYSGLPSGLDARTRSLPNEIDGRSSSDAEIAVTADQSVDPGTYSFTATARDSLGNTESFAVEVTVKKPPALGVEGGDVDVGDVLVGGRTSQTVTIVEQNGIGGIDGVSATVQSSDRDGSIDFDGLGRVRTDPSGSDTAEVTVTASENADQHETLSWDVRLTPDNPDGIGETVTVEGRVIYPARLGDLGLTRTRLTFEEPRSAVSSHRKTIEVDVPNDGDLEMNVIDATASVDDPRIDARVVDRPDTVDGLSEGTVTVEITADDATEQGSYDVTVGVETAEAGDETVTRPLRIEHVPELSVERGRLSFGEVIVTERLTESTDIAERLEYESISDLTITKRSGPDRWLTVEQRPPETLSPGETAPFVVAVQFDTEAELYRTYEWEFVVEGQNVESQVVTVSATAKPYSFDQIEGPLSDYSDQGGWQADTAGGVTDALRTVESDLRDGGDVAGGDLTNTVALGRSTLLFIDSVESARATRESDGPPAAQASVVRAASAYNLMTEYTAQIQDETVRRSAEESTAAAEETVTALVSSQEEYYQSRLSSDDLSKIERAEVKRNLAELALLQGDSERAERLRSEADTAFREYVGLVEEGNGHRQTARDRHDELKRMATVSVLGYDLVLNPGKLDPVESQSDAVLSAYDSAEASFRDAGATSEATRIQTERGRVATQLQVARYSLYGSTGVYALVFLVSIVRLARNLYTYVTESRAAVSGDFLLQ